MKKNGKDESEMVVSSTEEPPDQPQPEPQPGTAEEFLAATEPGPPVQLQQFVCDACGGGYSYEKWVEHASATGHESYELQTVEPPAPEQPALFETEGIVRRHLEIPVAESFQAEERKRLALLCQQAFAIEDQKKDFDASCNARLKPIKEEMRSLSDSLKRHTVSDWVECEWRLSTEENARVLVRLDTQEIVDRKPITAEDRAAEVEHVAAVNAEA